MAATRTVAGIAATIGVAVVPLPAQLATAAMTFVLTADGPCHRHWSRIPPKSAN